MPSKSKSQQRLMLAAAHTKGGYGGVPQKVGKEFVKADQAAGRLKREDPPMKKHSGHKGKMGGDSMMAGGEGKSPRKAMAEGGSAGGNFGVEGYGDAHGAARQHPDAMAGTGRKGMMEDGDRAIGHPVHHTKGHHPAQAAPDHGPTHPGGHGMHGQYDTPA